MNSTAHKKRVAVLRGGPSSEYEVSLQSGLGVLQSLQKQPYSVKDIIITRGGEWLSEGISKEPHQMLTGVDVVFIALHGAYGEDGTVQRILERLRIPYTGSDPYSSAIAMNKALTKEHLKKFESKVRMPRHIRVRKDSGANVAQLSKTIAELFGPEYVVKPLSGGSSIGTKLVSLSELYATLVASLEEYDEVLVEERIMGKEATVGILEGFRGERHYQLPPIEIVPPASASFFSADVKYSGETEEICPGRFSKSEKQELMEAAREVHELLGLRQYSRSDFIVTGDGVYFLEVNTLPGLTSQSLFPKSMEAVGSSYDELIMHLIESV